MHLVSCLQVTLVIQTDVCVSYVVLVDLGKSSFRNRSLSSDERKMNMCYLGAGS